MFEFVKLIILQITTVPDPPDGGYGWVIVAVAFCAYTLSMVTMANFGVFLVELVEHFQMKNVVLGWVGALQLSCHGLVGKATDFWSFV